MPKPEDHNASPRLHPSFGRRRGKPLRVTKQGLVETLLPQLLIHLPEGELAPKQLFSNTISIATPPSSTPTPSSQRRLGSETPPALDSCLRRNDEVKRSDELETPAWRADAPERPRGGVSRGGDEVGGASPYKDFYLEIGFGGGEHLAHQASLYPNIGIIGCEPYLNGVAGLLKHIDDEKLHNIRIYPDDARLLLEKLPDASISKVFILYPDPWPKIRHKKRRLIATALLNQLARIMKQGAELRIATDDEDYCTWILEHVLPHPAFTWPAKTSADWLNAPKDWVTTRYEQKKAVNRGLIPSYLNFIRKP